MTEHIWSYPKIFIGFVHISRVAVEAGEWGSNPQLPRGLATECKLLQNDVWIA